MRFRSLVLVLAATVCLQDPAHPGVTAQTPQQTVQFFDQFVIRLHNVLKLDERQIGEVRDILARHKSRIEELRARAQASPYDPTLQPDVAKEQREIRDELSALLDEEQRGKFAMVDTRLPVPLPPPFLPINIPPPSRREGVGDGTFAAREPLVAAPAANAKKVNLGRLTEDQKILHLLDRATFGPRPGDLDRVRKMGIAGFIEAQLNPESIEDPDLTRRLAVLPTQQMSTAELYQFYPPPNLVAQRSKQPNPPPVYGRPQQVLGELVQQKLVRAVSSDRQLQEVLTDFWFNHFNVFAPKEADLWLVASYERDVIRPRALGRFRDLLTAVAESPAMLFYLDNWLSVARDAKEPRPPLFRPPVRPQPGSPQGIPQIRSEAGTGDMMRPSSMDAQGKKTETRAEPAERVAQHQPQSNPQMKGDGSEKSRPAPPPRPLQRKRDINENYARELLELHTLGVNGGYTQKDVQEVARCFTGWTIDRPYQGGAFVFRPWMHDQASKTVLGVTIPAGGGMSDGLKVIEILARHPSTARFISRKLCQRFVSDDPSPQLVERIAQVFLKTDGDIKEVVRAILTSPEFNSPAAFRSKIKSPLELAASAIRALDGDTNGGPAIHDWLRRMGEPLYQYQFPTGYSENSAAWVNTGAFLNRINFGVALANNQIGGTRYDLAKVMSSTASSDEAMRQLAALLLHTGLDNSSLKVIKARLSEQTFKPEEYDRQLIALLLGAAEFQKK